MLSKCYTTSTGKEKAGHVNGLALAVDTLFSLKFPVTKVSKIRKEGYYIGGWGLSLEENADRDKHLLKTLFNGEIGKNPDGGLTKVIRNSACRPRCKVRALDPEGRLSGKYSV